MKRLSFCPTFFLAGLLTIFATRTQAQDLNSATLLTRSEQYDKAAAMFQELIQKEPANSKNYFFYGENFLSDYFSDTISNSLNVMAKSAKAIYQKGVDANPNDPLKPRVQMMQDPDTKYDPQVYKNPRDVPPLKPKKISFAERYANEV